MIVCSASPAIAEGPGGAAAPGAPHASSPGAAKPVPPVHTAPVTARTPSLTYRGPVYQRTSSGAIIPYQSPTSLARTGLQSGGSPVGVSAGLKPQLLVPGTTARYVGGLAAAPMAAPLAVQRIIWAGNQIVGLPYLWAGGHASFVSPGGYDCSGTVSFALHGARLLSIAEDSGEFMGFGARGLGRWVSIFADSGHAYMTVAGLRLDTSAADDPSNQDGPRWRPLRSTNEGFTVRHPATL